MKLFIKREKSNIDAKADYDLKTGTTTVLAGSQLSSRIHYTEKFRGAKKIEQSREGIVKNCVLTQDISFKSASTAANFVTGSSTNGLVAWKTKKGERLKDVISREAK